MAIVRALASGEGEWEGRWDLVLSRMMSTAGGEIGRGNSNLKVLTCLNLSLGCHWWACVLMRVLEDIVMHEAWFCGGRFGVLASEK